MEQLEIIIKGEFWNKDSLMSVSNLAQNINLRGYMDINDDSIELILQGSKNSLEEMLLWVQKGSFMKSIKSMSYSYLDMKVKFDKFQIKNESILSKASNAIKKFKYEPIDMEKMDLDFQKIPKHITIIPDGNRRWAREKNLHPWIGHMQITKNKSKLMEMFEVASKIGIEYITFWAFSTDNWKRDHKEVEMLLGMMRDFADEMLEEGKSRNIRYRHIGRRDRLPSDILGKIDKLVENTKDNSGICIQFAIDYGGKDEIVRGVNKIIEEGVKKVDVEIMNKYIDSGLLPPPDLIIRTGGERRTSGVMMWHSDYSELYFTNLMFPDFDAYAMIDAVRDYEKRVRRFGGTAKEDIKNIDKSKLKDK